MSLRFRSLVRRRYLAAFTLVELLTVIAIIGILAAILIPTVGGVRRSANKAKTRVLYNQWAAAIESFRQEYGFYPVFDSSNLVNPPGQSSDGSAAHVFHDILAAHRRNGDALPAYSSSTKSTDPEAQNRKLISFYSFSDSDLDSSNLLHDAFDHTEIAVLVDRNLDGVIRVGGTNADYSALPAVGGLTPTSDDFPSTGVRAHVIFYSVGADETSLILSWK